LVGFELHGKIDPTEHPKVLTYRGGTYTSKVDDESVWRGRYRVDPAHTPPRLEVIPDQGQFRGQTIRSIYQVEGGTLRAACRTEEPTRRPNTFHDESLSIVVYKRVK
jgi:uncharacterized protein (TIGR03067 family)